MSTHTMSGVTEYLTRYHGFDGQAFHYEVTVRSVPVARLSCTKGEAHYACHGEWVHPEHQHQELSELLYSLCHGRAKVLGWSAQLIANP